MAQQPFGNFGGGFPAFGSGFGLLRELRSIRTARQAREAELEIAQQQEELSRRRQVVAPASDSRQPPPEPSFLQNLRTIAQGVKSGPLALLPFDLANLSEGLQPPPALRAGAAALRISEQVNAPVTALTVPRGPFGLPSFNLAGPLLRPTEREQERRGAIGEAFSQATGGDFSGAVGTLTEFQRAGGTLERITTEAVSPVGLAENLVPIGTFGRTAKLVAAARTAQPRTFQVASQTFTQTPGGAVAALTGDVLAWTRTSKSRAPTLDDAAKVVQLPGFYEALKMTSTRILREDLRKIPGMGKFVNAVPEASSSNTEDIIPEFLKVYGIYKEQASAAATLMHARVFGRGDPRRLFSLDQNFFSTLDGPIKGKSINEIAQFPERFGLNAEQIGWLDNFRVVNDDMLRYMEAEGILPDAAVFGRTVLGRYFPNWWKTNEFLDNPLFTGARARKARAAARANPPFTKSRYFEDSSEALAAGMNPRNPNETILGLFQAQYDLIVDKKLNDALRPFFSNITKRLDGDIVQELRGLSERQILRDFTGIPPEHVAKLVKALQPETTGMLKRFSTLTAAIRSLQTGYDIGWGFIHGIPLLVTDPVKWTRAMGHSINAMRDPGVVARFADDNFDDLAELIQYNQLHMGGADLIEGLQAQGLLQKMFRGIETSGRTGRVGTAIGGGARRGTAAFERGFDGFLIASKVQLWQAMKPMALASPNPQQAMQELAFSIAKMTGTISMANLGIAPTTRQALSSFVMFAPRYRMASMALMSDIVRGGTTGQVARERLGKMLMGGLFAYSYMAHKAGQEPNLDPRSGKFMTIKVGDANIGVGSVWVSTARFLIGGGEQAFTSPGTFFNVTSSDSKLNRYVRSQIAPLTGVAWDTATGRNYIGEPTRDDWGDVGKNLGLETILPFYLSGLADYPRAGWSGVAPEFTGMRSFPVSFYDQGIQLSNIYAQQQHGKNYNDLNRLDKINLLKDHPDAQALFDEGNKLWATRSQGFREQVTKFRIETATLRTEYNKSLEKWMIGFDSQQIDGDAFRAELKLLGRSYADAHRRLRDVRFKEVTDAFAENRENPEAHLEDLAYDDYIATVIAEDFEVTDPEDSNFLGFDFRKRDQAIEEFISRWGQGLLNYVLERRDAARDTPPLLQELYAGRERMRPYWNVGDTILRRSGNEELLPAWENYQRASGEEKDDLAERYPIFRQTASAARKAKLLRRENDPQTDAFMFRWGYTTRLQNEQNKLLGIEEIRRTLVRFQ